MDSLYPAYIIINNLAGLHRRAPVQQEVLVTALIGLIALCSCHPDKGVASLCHFLLTDFDSLKAKLARQPVLVAPCLRAQIGQLRDGQRLLGLHLDRQDVLRARLELEGLAQQHLGFS